MNQFFEWISNVLRGARFWIVVLPWERCVRVRFGRWTKVLGSGTHPRIPFFDEIRLVNNRLRIAPVPFATVSTKDGKTVSLAASIGFRIVDPLAAFLRFETPEVAVAVFVQSALARYVAGRKMDEIEIEAMTSSANEAVRAFAPGIEFEFVQVVDFAAARTFRLLQEQWRPGTSWETEPRRT